MAKGLMGNMPFTELSKWQKEVVNRLAEIEQEDADRCNGCGGEDCCCCEYYLDRQKWKSPEELFADYDDPFHYEHTPRCDECGGELIEADEFDGYECSECGKPYNYDLEEM